MPKVTKVAKYTEVKGVTVNDLSIETIRDIALFLKPICWVRMRAAYNRKFTEALDLIFDDGIDHTYDRIYFLIACKMLLKGCVRLPLPPSTHYERFCFDGFARPDIDVENNKDLVFSLPLSSTKIKNQIENIHRIHQEYNAFVTRLTPSWSEYMHMLAVRIKLGLGSCDARCYPPVCKEPTEIVCALISSVIILGSIGACAACIYFAGKTKNSKPALSFLLVFAAIFFAGIFCASVVSSVSALTRFCDEERFERPRRSTNQCCSVSFWREDNADQINRYREVADRLAENFNSLPKKIAHFFQSKKPPLIVSDEKITPDGFQTAGETQVSSIGTVIFIRSAEPG